LPRDQGGNQKDALIAASHREGAGPDPSDRTAMRPRCGIRERHRLRGLSDCAVAKRRARLSPASRGHDWPVDRTARRPR
jgi:hypothetical protein